LLTYRIWTGNGQFLAGCRTFPPDARIPSHQNPPPVNLNCQATLGIALAFSTTNNYK
jgi:hypothetical protein